MEQIINKLSEIELATKSIHQEADQTKKMLSEKMEQQCREFDAALEQQTNTQIRRIRDELEKEKDARLAALRNETQEHLQALDAYFTANRQRLGQELFQRILQR